MLFMNMSRLVHSVSLVSLYMYVKGERQSVQVTTELLNRSPPPPSSTYECVLCICLHFHPRLHAQPHSVILPGLTERMSVLLFCLGYEWRVMASRRRNSSASLHKQNQLATGITFYMGDTRGLH